MSLSILNNFVLLLTSFIFQFMMKHGGIPTADSYGGYLGNDGFCHIDDPGVVIGFQIEVKHFSLKFLSFS